MIESITSSIVRISLVIPVNNEAESLTQLLREIDTALKPDKFEYEVLLIDDGSTDNSWDVIREQMAVHPQLRGVRFRRNFGKAAALQAGFDRARGSVILTLDADLQDDPKEISRFLTKINEGYDVVSGWKQVRHDPWHKVFPSRLFNAVVSRLTGVSLHDHNCGFKAYKSSVIREIQLYGEMHRFVPVLAARRGFRVGEITIEHRARKFGQSKYGFRRFFKGFLDLVTVHFLTAFGQRPQHLLGTIGLGSISLGLVGFLILFLNAFLRMLEETWGVGGLTQIFLAIGSVGFALFGSQLLLAGLLAELMVAKTQRGEPTYSIHESLP